MASGGGGSQCEACRGGIGLWQAAFTSECAHKFHLRCVSGRAACPVCAARWSDTPVTAPAPAPATTFSFAPTPPSSTGLFGKPPPSPFSSSTPSPAPANAFATPTPSSTGLFGQTSEAAANSSSQTTGLFGQPPPSTTPKPTSSSLSITAPANAFCFWTPPPPSTSLFGQTAAAAANSSQTGLFGQSPPSMPSPFSSSTPSLAPTNAFSFATSAPSWAANSSQTTGLFGQPSQSTKASPSTPKPFWLDPPFATCPALSSTSQTTTGLFGQPSPSPTQNSSSGFSFSFPQAQPASSPPSPPSIGTSLFGQPAPATPNPFWLGSTPSATQEPSCPVCHGAMGRGHATVTSECSHTFHLRCCSGSVCPVCGARWRDEVTVAPPASLPNPTPSPPRPPLFQFQPPPATNTPTTPFMSTPFPSTPPLFGPQTSPPDTERPVFSDDEPLDQQPLDGGDASQEAASNNGELVLTTHCEHKAVARDTALDNFAVLVHAKAPAAASSARAPLDLVTVLDVSGSMAGSKLALLKRAMGFVIDHLGPGDRLSIVAFSSKARRVIRLTRMSDGGKVTTKGAVESLAAGGATNIGDGLRVAAEILDGRRHGNPIASVILLSDGEDNQTLGGYGLAGCPKTYNDLVPPSLRRSGCNVMCPPVHTFGFGVDHDAAAMHAIAEATGGTFSFIQNQAVVQDSFAQCIGGLLSVAVQEARVAVECLHPGVRVRAVKSGRYESRVDADGRAATVDVGELYADEERRFLLFLDVPVAAEDGGVTPLIKVTCTYKDAATGWFAADVTCDDAAVQRPVVVSDMEPCVEVARELFRVEAAEDIAAARAAAERGAHAEAARILDRRREASAATGLAGDERCAELVAELRELSARVADRREYEQTGRACLLAGMSSHAQQRASTVLLFEATAPSAPPAFGATPRFGFGGFGPQQGSVFGTTGASSPFSFGASSTGASSPFSFGAGSTGASSLSPFTVHHASSAAPTFGSRFATPAMQSMVESSRKAREQQQSEPGGSIFGRMGKPAD
ncbi:unnamed protein product [Urochloa decumbens]|uniref:Uncharacterized protein n=1 Tax=Urochloa decumbens TaxID=240449 RepID=A0ABC8Z0X8_9POAL